jgi:hypothetical protein
MALPPLEAGTNMEATELTVLRYILDVLQGGGLVTGSYNTPAFTKKSAGAAHTVVAGTAHRIAITAEGQDVTVGVGSSTCKVLTGTTIYLEASGLFAVDIVITSGGTGSAHVFEMRP